MLTPAGIAGLLLRDLISSVFKDLYNLGKRVGARLAGIGGKPVTGSLAAVQGSTDPSAVRAMIRAEARVEARAELDRYLHAGKPPTRVTDLQEELLIVALKHDQYPELVAEIRAGATEGLADALSKLQGMGDPDGLARSASSSFEGLVDRLV